MADRLETVREHEGIRTITEFHRRVEEAGYEGSYSTARKYHAGENEPSLGYLVAVSEAFDRDLAWLATGRDLRENAISGPLAVGLMVWMAAVIVGMLVAVF